MNKKSINFDEKYKDLLPQLADLEKDYTVREAFIKVHTPNYDDFILDAMAAASEYYKNAVTTSQSDAGYCDPKALSICSKFDGLAFTEALHDAIKGYSEGSFRYLLIDIFNKKQNTHLGAEDFDHRYSAGSIPISDKKKCALGKLVREVKTFMKQQERMTGIPVTDEEILDKIKELREKSYSTLSSKDIELAFQFAQALESSAIVSLDKKADEDDSTSGALIDTISSAEDPYENTDIDTSEALKKLQAYWEFAQSSLKLERKLALRNRYSTLLTKRLMEPLKTYTDEDGKQVPFIQFPYGDWEMYELYRPFSVFLMQLFYQKYLARAFEEFPNNLHSVYNRKLRDDFNFSDKIAASVLGITASTYSKLKKAYESEFLVNLEKFNTWKPDHANQAGPVVR